MIYLKMHEKLYKVFDVERVRDGDDVVGDGEGQTIMHVVHIIDISARLLKLVRSEKSCQ